jgi:hypothetical protein
MGSTAGKDRGEDSFDLKVVHNFEKFRGDNTEWFIMFEKFLAVLKLLILCLENLSNLLTVANEIF